MCNLREDRELHLKYVRADILTVLKKYPGISLGWTCDDCTDLHGVYGVQIVLEDGGWCEVPLYEET